MKKTLAALVLAAFMLTSTGCVQKSYQGYTQAIKEQNMTMQIRIESEARAKETRDNQHEARMVTLTGNLIQNAAQTKSPNDDFMVPVLLMLIEDKRSIAELAATGNQQQYIFQNVERPDSIGDTIQKSSSLILGVASMGLIGFQSNNMKDIALGGMAASGIHNTVSGEGNTLTSDSYKSGSQNTITGDENVITGAGIGVMIEEEEIEEEEIEEENDA